MFIECPDLTENKKIVLQTSIKNQIYTLVFTWNEYCDCCFLDILTVEGKRLYCGNALTTNGSIFTKRYEIPELLFINKDLSTLEPTPETMKDFVIYYADNT